MWKKIALIALLAIGGLFMLLFMGVFVLYLHTWNM